MVTIPAHSNFLDARRAASEQCRLDSLDAGFGSTHAEHARFGFMKGTLKLPADVAAPLPELDRG